MGRASIGELEELLLLGIASLVPEAYGFAIKSLIQERANRDINLSAVHAALYRLEKKGLIKSQFGESTSKRGGKKKKYFEITAAGVAAIRESREIRNELWSGIVPSVLNYA
ncbi:MAG: PadR family transcriptional regulator [Bacteroidetes bacterium]|nr:MAG: PadR family transcriptional regulator [Bacteroidota bacterium]